MTLRPIVLMTNDEVVAELLRYNPFGGYQPPKPASEPLVQEREGRNLRETLARYRKNVN